MLCLFHKYELTGMFYEEYTPITDNYGLKLVEVHKCIKCGKEVGKVIDNRREVFITSHRERIINLKQKGIKDIVEYKLSKIK